MVNRYYLVVTRKLYLITDELGGMRRMFTAVNVIMRLSKDGDFSEEFLENIEDNVKNVIINTYGKKECCLNCDDLLLTSLKKVAYDTCEEEVCKDGVTVYCKRDEGRNLEKCCMVKLKGIIFKVVRHDGLVFLNNEITDKVDYTCEINSFEKLLESVDENYEVYSKEYLDL